jgi:hypothetical protein
MARAAGLTTPAAAGVGERIDSLRIADVAQLVEHFTRNEGVPGSSPGVGSLGKPRLGGAFLCAGSSRAVARQRPGKFAVVMQLRPATGQDLKAQLRTNMTKLDQWPVSVNGDTATVRDQSGKRTPFVKQGGRWLINDNVHRQLVVAPYRAAH